MKSLILLFALISLTSCAGRYRVNAAPGSITRGTVSVMPAMGAEGDAGCKRGIQNELVKRGFTLVEPAYSGGGAESIAVRYSDEWKWDMAMFLWAMDIHFTDPNTSIVKATVSYKNRWWHTFPKTSNIARRAFEALDQKGAFAP